jgi:hypothetical protein
MDRQNALRLQLRMQLYTLAGALRRGEADGRRLWALADGALDTHDEAGLDHATLRNEVVGLMRDVAACRSFDAPALADRLKALADDAAHLPRRRELALAV